MNSETQKAPSVGVLIRVGWINYGIWVGFLIGWKKNQVNYLDEATFPSVSFKDIQLYTTQKIDGKGIYNLKV